MTISEQLFESKSENYLKYGSVRRISFVATIAKGVFAVDQSGAFMPGPLFIMEKMPAGFNYVSGDWRYTSFSLTDLSPEAPMAKMPST